MPQRGQALGSHRPCSRPRSSMYCLCDCGRVALPFWASTFPSVHGDPTLALQQLMPLKWGDTNAWHRRGTASASPRGGGLCFLGVDKPRPQHEQSPGGGGGVSGRASWPLLGLETPRIPSRASALRGRDRTPQRRRRRRGELSLEASWEGRLGRPPEAAAVAFPVPVPSVCAPPAGRARHRPCGGAR